MALLEALQGRDKSLVGSPEPKAPAFRPGIVYNWIAHPLMPLADLLDEIGEKRVSALLHRLHDTTYPEGDG